MVFDQNYDVTLYARLRVNYQSVARCLLTPLSSKQSPAMRSPRASPLGFLRLLSTPPPQQSSLLVTSYFRIPSQNMDSHELLSRGSGFFVHGPGGRTLAVISAHVAAPHRYRRYFPADWLDFVRDEHVRLVIGDDPGAIAAGDGSVRLADAFRHAELDVAAVVVGEDVTGGGVLGFGEVMTGERVEVCGRRDGGKDERMAGEVVALDGERGFVDTGDVESVMGMCGGPVVRDGRVVGLLEGLVPRVADGKEAVSEMHGKVAGCSVFVGAKEIQAFVDDVEKQWERSLGCGEERI